MADLVPNNSRVSLRRSLRLRMPLLISALVLVIVTTFLWMSYRQVEATLVKAGGDRAQRAANEVARLLVGTSQGLAELRQIAEEGTLQRYFKNQTDPSGESVRLRLAPLATSGPRRIELWSAAGSRVLEIPVSDTSPPVAAARVLPEVRGPFVAGVSPLHALDDLVYTDLVAEIPADTAALQGAGPLGYLVIRATYSVNPPGAIGYLVGQDAVVEIGNRSGGVWTDFSKVVRPPPVDVTRTGVAEYRSANGGIRLGAAAPIPGTPWALWVEFPKALVTAPARSFLNRMIAIAASFVVIGAMLAFVLSSRITQPIEILSLVVHKVAAGEYSRRVTITRKDELGRLGTGFNMMADKVERAYAALAKHHEQTQFALAASRMGVWEVDLKSKAVSWSDTMPQLFGLKAEDAPRTQQAFLTLVHPDDRQPLDQATQRAIENRGEYQTEFRTIWPDGSIHWLVGRGRVMTDNQGQPSQLLGIDIDVSEQKALEEQLRQAQKMEAVGQLAGGVAHDFNNLLTAILGYGNLILEQAPGKSSLHTDITEILRAGESAARLTQQLLAFSRRQIMHPEVVLVNDVIESTEKLLRRLIFENIRLVTNLDPNLRPVTIDQGQLEQVLVNLVVNARDAMPDGGTLTLETTNADLDESYGVAHASVASGPYVRLTVSDTGVGMSTETQKRLFEPFYTTKPEGKGTGLGLATVFGIVKQSGGHIFVYSELRHGSSFKIYLPIADAPAATALRRAPAPSLVGGSETILVVEDNDAARVLARRVLEHAGYRIIVAANGEDALDLIRDSRQPIQLVVTDVIMPGITGPELARRIEKTHPEIRILFTSGYADDAIIRHGVLEPGAQFIQKPYTPIALSRKVRESLI